MSIALIADLVPKEGAVDQTIFSPLENGWKSSITMIITNNLRVSAWCIPILGTASLPTTTDVMKSLEANIASSLNNLHFVLVLKQI